MNKLKKIAIRAIVVVPALLLVALMRAARPWILIRIVPLFSSRIGHYAANTEVFLCEKDAGINVPRGRSVDLYYNATGRVANIQLEKMWRRALPFAPERLLSAAARLNRMIPGGRVHEHPISEQSDRDPRGLLALSRPHLRFTEDEEALGKRTLEEFGIPDGAKFVCMIGRDRAYLDQAFRGQDYSYHSYRDVDIETFLPAALALAERGYFVIRMGAIVSAPLKTNHPRIVDYAGKGMRSDFMDIYLGANCLFSLGVACGFESIPRIFRKPLVIVNYAPVGYFLTFERDSVSLCKRHRRAATGEWLSLSEIFRFNTGYCLTTACYESAGVELVDNTPEEIKDAVMEMLDRVTGDWNPEPEDAELQRRFWELFPLDGRDTSPRRELLHGKVLARYSARILRDHPEFLS